MEPFQEPPLAEDPEKSRLKRLIARMGLGAFSISLIVHGIFIVLAIFYFVKWVEPKPEKVDFLPGGGGGGGAGGETAHKVQQQMKQRMMTSTAVSKRIASTSNTAAFSLPDSSNELMDPGLPMDIGAAQMGSGGGEGGGRGTGKGTGTGSGTGPGKGFGEGQLGIGALIPTIMKGRCTDAERLQMVREAGGTEAIENGVKKSLAWLKANQNSDGSWGSSYKAGMTGLSLLCYLGHCEGVQSKEYGEVVSKAIAFLLDISLKNNGRIATNLGDNHWVYEHGIATYALAEALTFSRTLQFPIPELEPAVAKAATYIIEGQTKEGGWDYKFSDAGRNDLSVAGWQLQALKAAKASGVKLENADRTIRRATTWLTSGAYADDGVFRYTDGGAPAMTAVGTLCLQQWDKGNSSPARAGVKLIMEGLELRTKPKSKPKHDYSRLYKFDYDDPNNDIYAWYYAVQVMRNAGGDEWEAMNKAIIEDILTAQSEDGSFKPEPTGGDLLHLKNGTGSAGGSRMIYLQTLNTLMLEVYYRFLPATSAGKSRSSGLRGLDDLR